MALLSDLANAAIARSLPTLDGWLRERLGDQARIHSAKLEGKRVLVERAHLPLGPRIDLEIASAEIAVAKSLANPRLYVRRAEGELTVRGGGRELTAQLTLEQGRDAEGAWLCGPVEVAGAGLRGKLRAQITKTSWRLEGNLADEVSTQHVLARGPLGTNDPVSEFRLDLKEGSVAQIIEQATAWLDLAPPTMTIAEDARQSGEVSWRDRQLSIKTARSAIEVEPLSGSVQGEVALADVHALGLFTARWRPTPRGTAKVSLTTEDGATSGTVTIEALELETVDRAGVPILRFEHVEAEARVTRDEVNVTRWSCEGYGTSFTGAGALGGVRPLLVARFVDANVDLARALATLTANFRFEVARDAVRPIGERWLPPDLQLSGQLSIAQDSEVRAELALESSGSALMIPLTVAAETERLDGTQLRGRVSTADALGLGILDGPLALVPKGTWNVRADLTGVASAPIVRAHVETASCEVNVWGQTDLTLTDVEADVLVDHEAVIWKGARCKAYGGTATSEGVMSTTATFSGMDVQLRCDDVAIDDLHLSTGPIRDHVTGAVTAEVHFRKLDAGAVSGGGSVTLDDAAYPAILHAHDQLADVALPVPPPEAVSPLTCSLTFGDAHLEISELEAQVDGITVHAGGKIGYGGGIEGGASARLRAAYLKRSPLFVIPAALAGGITVPIHIGGTLSAPILTTNVGQALRDKLRTKEISGAVSRAFNAIDDAISNIGGRPPAQPADNPELEALVDRIMADSPDTDELIDRLIEAGVTSDQIVRILEKRRIRFS